MHLSSCRLQWVGLHRTCTSQSLQNNDHDHCGHPVLYVLSMMLLTQGCKWHRIGAVAAAALMRMCVDYRSPAEAETEAQFQCIASRWVADKPASLFAMYLRLFCFVYHAVQQDDMQKAVSPCCIRSTSDHDSSRHVKIVLMQYPTHLTAAGAKQHI